MESSTRYNPDTIAAIATAPGEAGIAVVRLSGPASLAIADRLFEGRQAPSSLAGGRFLHGFIRSPGASGGAVHADEVILLVYRAPHSYTREDVVELQGHGGRICAGRILKAVLAAGARMAESGEFTKRAFLNGRLDLVQAEAVADLIRAGTDRAAAAALEQLEGALSRAFNALYDGLLDLAADIEATLDFVEDELPESTMPELAGRLRAEVDRAGALLATWEEGHLLRDGALVVISGRPNVGKSTLLNRLVGFERAIVTPIPGTTRDTIEEQAVLAGIPLRLIDTAGIREAESAAEREGIRRTHASLARADITVHMLDAGQPPARDDLDRLHGLKPERTLVLLNKSDLPPAGAAPRLPAGMRTLSCSLLTDRDLPRIRRALIDLLHVAPHTPPHAAIAERHRAIVQRVLAEMNDALALLGRAADDGVPLAAQHLRMALTTLGEATGREYATDLLDRVFSRFCIGK